MNDASKKKPTELVNNLLGYEGLKIIQRPDIFNFSLDSTLLADFVTIKSSDKRIIDLGCGNGYIPIFLTLRTNAQIWGIEIQQDIYDLAQRSVALNNLQSKITLINDDIKHLGKVFNQSYFDIVVCNPPYFKYHPNSNVNKNDWKTIARHEKLITLEEVIQNANHLLKDGGTFAIVHRSERLIDILEYFRKYGIEPKKMRFVYPKYNSTKSLAVLIEGKKSQRRGNLKILQPLYVHKNDQEYTDEVLKIFNYQKSGD